MTADGIEVYIAVVDLVRTGAAELARTAVRASFAADQVKARIPAEIDGVASGWRTG